jgi:hypothetical protein
MAGRGMTEAPAFLRRLRVHGDERKSGGWLASCPIHANEGFAVLVIPDEQRGRYRLECLSSDDPCPEQRLFDLFGLGVADLALAANGVVGETLLWEWLSDVEMRSIAFVDKPLWQASAFHLLTGRKGVGKGTLLANHAARVTRGELGPKTRVA